MKSRKNLVLGVFLVLPLLAGVSMFAGCGGGNGDDDEGTFEQLDRMGLPAINTALVVGQPDKQRFNMGDPSTDTATWAASVQARIESLRNSVRGVLPAEDSPGVSAATLTSVVIPDDVTVDFSVPVVFPNGRRFQDDVIDAELGLIFNRGNALGGGRGVSDGVGDDSTYLATFPYLSNPNP